MRIEGKGRVVAEVANAGESGGGSLVIKAAKANTGRSPLLRGLASGSHFFLSGASMPSLSSEALSLNPASHNQGYGSVALKVGFAGATTIAAGALLPVAGGVVAAGFLGSAIWGAVKDKEKGSSKKETNEGAPKVAEAAVGGYDGVADSVGGADLVFRAEEPVVAAVDDTAERARERQEEKATPPSDDVGGDGCATVVGEADLEEQDEARIISELVQRASENAVGAGAAVALEAVEMKRESVDAETLTAFDEHDVYDDSRQLAIERDALREAIGKQQDVLALKELEIADCLQTILFLEGRVTQLIQEKRVLVKEVKSGREKETIAMGELAEERMRRRKAEDRVKDLISESCSR